MTREDRARELGNILRGSLVREGSHGYALLDYLATRALSGPAEPAKEYAIGVDALGKSAEYDPRLDPTVRVEIGRLRRRLNEFYSGDGARHDIRINIPKGAYAAEFVPNSQQPQGGRPAIWTPPPAGHVSSWRLKPVWLTLLLTAIATAGLLALVEKPGSNPALSRFWAPQLKGSLPTLLVYGAPMFLKVNGSYFRDPNGNSPADLERSGPIQTVVAALRPSEMRPVFHFTGFGETEGAFRITRLLASGGAQVALRRSNEVSWEELKREHVVLLGGAKFNRQIRDLPYRFKFESLSRRIVNRFPGAGEPPEYVTRSDTPHGAITQEFALISSYPGLGTGSRLIVLDSSSSEGTNVASEFLTREDSVRDLLQRMGRDAAADAFQVVVKGKFKDGVLITVDYETHAVLANSGRT